jgi:hypothetical protein
MQNFNKILITLALVQVISIFSFSLALVGVPSIVNAANPSAEVCNDPRAQDSAYCQSIVTSANGDPLTKTISKVTLLFSIFGGVIAVFFVIFGGFRYIVSDGNPERIKTATNTIVYALIGLVVIAASQTIIYVTMKWISK